MPTNRIQPYPGYRVVVSGGSTISSDPAWKYVSTRRYLIYLESSIEQGAQWAVFEPNGEALWANVRAVITDFLLNEWRSGALAGDKPQNAYFVRCDRTTADHEFENWANKVWQYGAAGGAEQSADFRKDIVLELYNEAGQVALA